jgi:hypothetical protein
LPQTIIDKFPFLKGAPAFKIPQAQLAQIPALLKDQLVLVKFNGAKAADATSKELGKGEQGIRRERGRLEPVCSPE